MTEHLQLFRSQGGAGYIDIFIGQRLDIGLRRHIAGSISQQKSVKKLFQWPTMENTVTVAMAGRARGTGGLAIIFLPVTMHIIRFR